MTTDISDLYFNYVENKKDNIKYYAFAISRENTDSIRIKYVLCSDSNVEEGIASHESFSGISWKGFHVKEKSQNIENCIKNCADLNRMLDLEKDKDKENDYFLFVLYKVSQTGTTFKPEFLKFLFGQLTNNYEIIDYEISNANVEEKNVLDAIERWKKKIAGNTAIQKALATAIDTAKQMKLKIDSMKSESKTEEREAERLAEKEREKEYLMGKSGKIWDKYNKDIIKLEDLLESHRSINHQKMQDRLKNKKKKDKHPRRKSASSTSPDRPSRLIMSRSAPNLLSKESPKSSDSVSGSSLLDITELQNFPETKIIPDSNLDVPTESEDVTNQTGEDNVISI